MRVTFLGHSAFLVETAGARIVIDPYLTENPAHRTELASLPCDYILCTHAHSDHIGDALPLARLHRATLVAPYELAEHFSAQGATTIDLMPGGGIDLTWGRIQMTPAIHSSALEFDGGKTHSMGVASGFIIRADGRTLYHAGDTALFSDMSLIGRHQLDLALIPIGDHYTMGPADALTALDFLRPKLCVPMHYNTHSKIMVDAPAFSAAAKVAGHSVRLLKPTESVNL